MKIIIVGAGRIGTNLSKTLADEDNEVYLIEHSEDKASKVSEKLDAKVIFGSGADPDTLLKANVKEADLVLSVTTSDETNLVVCSLASTFGAKRNIARVRNIALSNMVSEAGVTHFGVDELINPELVAARSIVKTVESPGASEVSDFAGGRILLRAFDVPDTSPLCGSKIVDLAVDDFPWPFLIVSIFRDDKVIIPKGDTTVEAKDKIYVLVPAPSLAEFLTFVNPEIKMSKKVVVYGATITGKHVAETLTAKKRDIILIEEDAEKAREIAGELEAVTIINGSASEADILTECGIEAADVFVAATDNDHMNLIGSVLAKEMGAKSTIITTQHPDYMSIVHALDIDAIVNPYYLAVERILSLVRGKGISTVAKLLDGEAEAIELIAEQGAAVTKDVIKNIKFPKNSIVGAVYRGGEVALANGDTQIHSGEKAVVFCQKNVVKKLQVLFTNA